jgi:hypothetical protein
MSQSSCHFAVRSADSAARVHVRAVLLEHDSGKAPLRFTGESPDAARIAAAEALLAEDPSLGETTE